MRNIATRPGSVRLAGAIAVAAAVTAAIAVPAAGAAAAALPPTIATSYTPSTIGLASAGQSSGVAYTITDPNSTGSLYQVSFADTLPSFATVDDPLSDTTTGCGSGAVVTATPGQGTISAGGITVKAGTPCVISVAIAANSVGKGNDTYTSFAYTSSSAAYALPGAAPASGEKTATLTALGAPKVSVSSPRNKRVYKYGQSVKVTYKCGVASGDDPTQLACTATDDIGKSYNSGQKLDTKVPGKHELDVEALSGVTGVTTDAFVDYTVLPDNLFTVTKVKTGVNVESVTLKVPGAGKISITARLGGRKVATASAKARKKGKVTVKVKPSKAGQALLATASRTSKLKLTISYTPRGGRKHTITKSVRP